MSDFTTLREGSLHAALKARYAATVTGARVEAAVGGFVVDIAGRDELVEIQTSSFASARRKLELLVALHRVVLVHPIPIEKWLVLVDADGAVVRRRRSPKRGLALDLFDELASIPGLVAHPNFRIELALICEEELRGPIPDGARYRYPREWWRLDRRLVDVVDTLRIDTPADLLRLLPAGLPESFTTADIVDATGRSKRLAMRAVYCLAQSGAIVRLGRRGRLMAYAAAMRAPTFIPPMLATLVAGPFDDPDWQFEIKWDGLRVEAVIDGDTVRLWTRGEQDAARYFGAFLEPPSWISARQAVVDGEVIALDDHSEPDFALLQARIKGQGSGGIPTPFVYEAFDLLHLDGRSLLEEPLEERRRLLAGVLRADPRVRLSEHIEADGMAFFEVAKRRGLEGIMAKDRRSTYLPGKRSMAWQKIKIRPVQELVVGGWAPGTGKAVDLGALLVGVYEDGTLRYAGKIGAGFNDVSRAEVLAAMSPLAAEGPPFVPAPPRAVLRTAQWLRPELVIRAEFAGWAADGLVRQAAYKGLDIGKDPRKVVREVPGRTA